MNDELKQTIERYSQALELAMDIVWMKQAIAKSENKIKTLLTYNELANGYVNSDAINDAFQLSSLSIEEREYVKSVCKFRDAEVFLHERLEHLTSNAFNEVIKAARLNL